MNSFFKVIATLLSVLSIVTANLKDIFNGDIYPYESVTRTVGLETLQRTQGVTNDGEYWYFSGKNMLSKVNIETNETVLVNYNPYEAFEETGIDHIGGIGYYNGYIYVSLEDSHVFNYPAVAVYDAETLEYTGKMTVLDTQLMTRGCPWVCCDAQSGYFYVAQCDDSEEIFCYDLETMEYVKSIPLSYPIDEIQGAEVYEGCLYAATNDPTRAVYRIDLSDGTVTKYFDRIMFYSEHIDNLGGEGEGITVLEMEDGTVFHALDIGTLFIDSNLRHYKPVESE